MSSDQSWAACRLGTTCLKLVLRQSGDAKFWLDIIELADIRAFAGQLHERGMAWEADAFGWHAEYIPQRAEPPVQSRLPFTPAEFCIGESGPWFFSLVWERGAAGDPVEFLDDSGLVR
ncbi:MAG: hypothetical protein WCO90_05265 [Planctomycetota bacterium]